MTLCLALALALVLELEAGAQTFPVPGPGHVPWVATGGAGGGIAGVEKRCTDLGANCVCSEPLDTTEDFAELPGSTVDFADSPSTHECNFVSGGAFGSERTSADFSMQLAASVAPMPAGSTVTRVMQLVGGGNNYLYGRAFATASDQRICLRYYMRVSNDFSGAGTPGGGCQSERNKVMQFAFGQSRLIQMEERSDFGSGCYGPGTYKNFWLPSHADPTGTPGQFTIDWDDCNSATGWCRFELCAEGDLDAGTGINIEGRITAIAVAKDEIRNTRTSGTWSPGVPFGGFAEGVSADIFHGQGSGPVGSKWISHFMQAAWPTAAGQWIGPACEVEGGC